VNRSPLAEEIRASLVAKAQAAGVALGADAGDIADYAAARAADLLEVFGLPEYEKAQAAAVDAIALYAGLKAVEEADAGDAQVRAFLGDVVRIGVAALASAGG